jgi:2-methylisocitrate lyase-like PEP mutase family enzyme
MLPGAADAITARVVEQTGFAAVYLTGAGYANASYGLPDIGLVGLDSVAEQVRRIADVVDVPVVVDADTGYGGVLGVARTVRQLERAGAAAIQLEDQVDPKRCGHFDGQTVIPESEMLAKLAAATDARQDALVIARTDARSAAGFEAAVQRGQAYAQAGADLIFIEAPRDRDELAQLPRRVSAPLVANMVEGGKTPLLTAGELQELGFRVALFANTALRSAVFAVQQAMATLHQTGGTAQLADRMLGWDDRQRLVGLPAMQAAEDRYYST